MRKFSSLRTAAAAFVVALVPVLAISLADTASAAPGFTARTDPQRSFQIYACDAATHTYKNVRPDAILITPSGKRIVHGAGPSWTARDGSRVTGTVVARFPQKDRFTIPDLILKASNQSAPGTLFAGVRVIRRTDTVGGVPRNPDASCTPGRDGELRVPYQATYIFS